MITFFDIDDENLEKLLSLVDDLPFSASIKEGFKHSISNRSDFFFDGSTLLGYKVVFDRDCILFSVSCLVKLENDYAYL